MKKILSCLILTAISCIYTLAEADVKYSASFTEDNLQITSVQIANTQRAQIVYQGLPNTGEIGAPSVPVLSKNFAVPSNAVNISVSASAKNAVKYALSDSIAYQTDETSGIDLTPGTLVYVTDYPQSNAVVRNVSYAGDGPKIVSIDIFPVLVSTDRMGINFYKNVDITITYDLGEDTNLYELSSFNDRITVSRNKMLSQNVENWDLYETQEPTVRPFTTDQEDYEYIIITPGRFMKSFERLAAMRRSLGVPSRVFALEYILNKFSGDETSKIYDNAGKLREFIKYAYQYYGTQYVLLAGKYPEMPLRYATGVYSDTNPSMYEVPTDFYFSELNNKWERVGTSDLYKFSSPTYDRLNEVSIGRINISDETEIENFIDKIQQYEFHVNNENPDYLGKSMLVYQNDALPIDRYIPEFFSSLKNIYGESNISELKGKEDKCTGKQVISAWNSSPSGAQCFIGHGNPGGIGVSMDSNRRYYGVVSEDANEAYHIAEPGNGLDCLNIPNYPSWCFSIACMVIPNDYKDVDLNNLTSKYHFGDALTIGSTSGSVVFFANTRDSYTPDGYACLNYFYSNLFKNINSSKDYIFAGNSFSDLLAFSSISKYERLQKGLIGDPRTPLWTKTPKKLSYQVQDSLYRISGSIDGNYIVCRKPIIDATYATYTSMSQAEVNSLATLPNQLYTVYSKSSTPIILPLYITEFTWWAYACQYIYADYVKIGDLNGERNTVCIYDESNPVIEAQGNVELLKGLYITSGTSLTVISKGTVTISDIHIGDGATLKVIAENVELNKGTIENDGQYILDITERGNRQCSVERKIKVNDSAPKRPFVEEGKTWWYFAGLTKEQISNMQNLNLGHFEYGFSIGSKVTIDGKEWNKVYLKMRYTNVPNPYDPEDYNSFKVYDEDDISCGYIREEDGKVYTYEAGLRYGFTYYEFGFEPRWTYGPDVLIYDFSNDVQSFAFGTEKNIVFNLDGKNVIESHNNTFNDYTFTSEFLSKYKEEQPIHFVESVGALPFESVFFRNLFFMPFAETLTKGGSGMHYLTYVTDAQNNVIFEDAGGRKLWEFYNGVDDILMDTDENEPIEWYNMNGIKIPNPTENGIYIRRQGKSAQKILIK